MTSRPRAQCRSVASALVAILLSGSLLDCASPGPPRAPSLRLPRVVRDLSAARVGRGVDLRFTVPRESTDGLPLRGGMTLGTVCRSEGAGACLPFAGAPVFRAFSTSSATGSPNVITLRDELETGTTSPLGLGPPRLLAYRVEFFNAGRRSAGPSQPVFAAAGEAPAPVAHMVAEGSRGGVLLRWGGAAQGPETEVLLRRESVEAPAETKKPRPDSSALAPRSESDGSVWLEAHSGSGSGNRTLDDSAAPGQTYRYQAQRRRIVRLAGHTLEQRSALSPPLVFAFADTFPPAGPANLTAAGFGERDHYAVDLIWEPAEDRAVTGYVVTRVPVDSAGHPTGSVSALTSAAVTAPAFHDATANSSLRYLYAVVAVDAKGNRSSAATITVEPLGP